MILGQAVQYAPGRPGPANPNAIPRLPQTAWNSHFQPFPGIMSPMAAVTPFMPRVPGPARPGYMAPMPAPAPAPGPVAGFGSAFGRGGGVNPYRVMRTGMFPGVKVGKFTRGATNAGQLVSRLTKGFPGRVLPAGGYVPGAGG